MNFLLIIIPAILIIVSQAYIKCSYNKYREFSVKSGKSGYETAREILDSNGLSDVRIVKIGGELTDNFNPKTNTISLSSDIYDDKSIASVSVAAHECGHVIQHKEKYAFIVLRSILVPIVSIPVVQRKRSTTASATVRVYNCQPSQDRVSCCPQWRYAACP